MEDSIQAKSTEANEALSSSSSAVTSTSGEGCSGSADQGGCSGNSSSSDNENENGSSSEQQSDQLPIEYQLYEVDMTNPDMDPLEYTFRRYVPIPKQYYWDTPAPAPANEESNDNNNIDTNNQKTLPFRIKLWHCSIYYLDKCLKTAEAGGEVIANILGLQSGPFDYVTNNMTEAEMAQSRRNLELRREEREEVERRKDGGVV